MRGAKNLPPIGARDVPELAGKAFLLRGVQECFGFFKQD